MDRGDIKCLIKTEEGMGHTNNFRRKINLAGRKIWSGNIYLH